jgi:hypothetical protein
MPSDPDEIPLFPLPQVVLFPRTTVPLYIFEPRYRQMTRDALAGVHRRIGMVSIPEAHWHEMEDAPPVADIACEGEIVGAERNEDGTYQILLRGTRIVRILSELPPEGTRSYRRARVATRPDVIVDGDLEALRSARGQLFVLLSELVRRTVPEHAGQFGSDRFKDIDDVQLVNTLAQAMELTPRDKQQLLEVDRVRDRQRMLCDLMRFRIAEIDAGAPGGSSQVH